MYLLSDSTGQWRTVVHKGTRDNERTPTIFLEPQTRCVRVRMCVCVHMQLA